MGDEGADSPNEMIERTANEKLKGPPQLEERGGDEKHPSDGPRTAAVAPGPGKGENGLALCGAAMPVHMLYII